MNSKSLEKPKPPKSIKINNALKHITRINNALKNINKVNFSIKPPYKETDFETEKQCNACLEYYKQNPITPMLNLHKLLLSIKLTFCLDYVYTKLDYIIMFLPLLDSFVKHDNDTKNTHTFTDLYTTLKSKSSLTFLDIDYLIVLLLNILKLENNTLQKSIVTIITFINTILQLFRDIVKSKNPLNLKSLLLSLKNDSLRSYIESYFESYIEIYNEKHKMMSKNTITIDTIITIETVKEILGEDIFKQLTLLIEDYNRYFKHDEPIDIQNYLKAKIADVTNQISFIDFGILPKLLNINQETSISGGARNSIMRRIGSSIRSSFTSKKYAKLKEEEITISSDNWNTLKSTLNTKDTIYDVIANEKNEYKILHHILGSISIKISNTNDTDDINKIIKYFNDYIYTPYYGKLCYSVDKTQYHNNNNESPLISNTTRSTKLTKSIKSHTTKSIKTNLTTKVIRKQNIGLDEICSSLNQELEFTSNALQTFDHFIGKLVTLNFKYISTSDKAKQLIKKQILLLFIKFIMQNNIGHYIKLQINDFIDKISKDKEFLTEFESHYTKNLKFLSNLDKQLDKNLDKEILEFINKAFSKIDAIYKSKVINYFTFYYNLLFHLVNDFVNNKDAIIDTYSINPSYNRYLLNEHKLDKTIFIYLFRYTIPISSNFIEEFINFKVINSKDGFNYIQYNNNKISNEKYIQSSF
jgi:hypothetical protein